MKQFLFFALFMGYSILTFSQKALAKTTDVYTILKALLPDEKDESVLKKWSDGFDPANGINWGDKKTSLFYDYKTAYVGGTANVCNPKNKFYCSVGVNLYGRSAAGYEAVSIWANLQPNSTKCTIESLLKQSQYTAQLLQNTESKDICYRAYELTIPGKRKVWLLMTRNFREKMDEANPARDEFNVICYFDKAEYLSRVNVKDDEIYNVFNPTFRIPVPVLNKSNDKTKLTPAAKIIFKDVFTKLSNAEKNLLTDHFVLYYDPERKDTILTLDFKDGDGPVGMNAHMDIYPTDMNNDGVEEIFIRTTSLFFGQWLADLTLYIKNDKGVYEAQDAASPHLHAMPASNLGYPDLIGGEPEGPGINNKPLLVYDVFLALVGVAAMT